MADQQRLKERAYREACQLRDHKVQDGGKSERLDRVECTATCRPAQLGQLIPTRRDGSRSHDKRGRLDSTARHCRLPPHGSTANLPPGRICDSNLSFNGGMYGDDLCTHFFTSSLFFLSSLSFFSYC